MMKNRCIEKKNYSTERGKCFVINNSNYKEEYIVFDSKNLFIYIYLKRLLFNLFFILVKFST